MKRNFLIILVLINIHAISQNIFPASGNVGIGITNPQGLLHVYGSNAYLWGLNLGYGTSLATITTDASSKPLSFQIAGVEYARLHSNGNFGVGTSNPAYKFEVSGENGTTASTITVNRSLFLQAAGETSRLATNASYVNSTWQLSDLTAKAATIEIRNTGIIEMYATQTNGGLDWKQMFGFDAPNNKVYFPNGNIGIGTISPSEKLSVNGNIRSKKLIVTQTGWSDYVFDSSYQLKPLTEIEQFIKINKHLPDVPTAKQVEKEGIDVGDNQALLLKKIEELTLYMIKIKKENELQQKKITELEMRFVEKFK